MKKIIALLLTMMLVITLVSCSGGTQKESDTGADQSIDVAAKSVSESSEQSDRNNDIHEDFSNITERPGSNGSETFFEENQIPKLHRVTDNIKIDDEYAVYTNPYPVGQGGPLYSVNSDDLPRMEEELRDILPYFFSEDIASSLEITYADANFQEGTSYFQQASHNGIDISINPYKYILVKTNELSIDFEAFEKDPSSVSLVHSALKCCGIKDPVLSKSLFDEYIIYDKNASDSNDSAFTYGKSITVSAHTIDDVTTVSIGICMTQISDYSSTMYKSISYEQAFEFFKQNHPLADLSSVICVTAYDSEAYVGYYTPIYDFYFKEPERTLHDNYCRVKISAVEFTPEVELH